MITINNLAFAYGKTPVLRNISMTLEPGKIYGLLGENGVGKTTLLTLLCGLKKPNGGSPDPSTGGKAARKAAPCAISIDGMDPYKRRPSLLREVFYLPDEVAEANMTAREFAANSGTFWPGFDHSCFEELMRLFETPADQRMNRMSAGQLKKAHISFALACKTRYIFMDEPTNALDIPSKAQFRSAILKYTKEDATILISTHQVRDLENIIDPIIILERQDVLLNASLAEISEKLYFDYGPTLHPDSLYSEQLPGGFIQVRQNTTGEDSKVSVEALFNTAHKNKGLIKQLFTK